MARVLAAAVLLVLLALVALAWLSRESLSPNAVVAAVIDGDTIELADGHRVRLIQIDTPEQRKECYGDEASALTRRLLPPGTSVRIEQDSALDQVDRYERRLAYVWKGAEDVNVTLVREGAAGVWFYRGKRGRHAAELLHAAEQARARGKGLWGACSLARFDPADALSTGPAS